MTLFARRYMGWTTADDLIEWAVLMLEDGYMTKSLSILASLAKPLYPSEVEDYFHRSLQELGLSPPEREEALRWHARHIASQILGGGLSASQGCAEIYAVYTMLDYPSDLAAWMWLSEGQSPDDGSELSEEEFEKAVRLEAQELIRPNINPC